MAIARVHVAARSGPNARTRSLARSIAYSPWMKIGSLNCSASYTGNGRVIGSRITFLACLCACARTDRSDTQSKRERSSLPTGGRRRRTRRRQLAVDAILLYHLSGRRRSSSSSASCGSTSSCPCPHYGRRAETLTQRGVDGCVLVPCRTSVFPERCDLRFRFEKIINPLICLFTSSRAGESQITLFAQQLQGIGKG